MGEGRARLVAVRDIAEEVGVFERIRRLAPYEPLGNNQAAADLLYETACRKWSSRFGEINTIALTELNALIAAEGERIDTSSFDARLLKNLPSDIRIVLSWNADNTDIDLWVTDPNGEKCFYGRVRTRIGGRLSRDCISGYGPEEFMIKTAIPGTYLVEAYYCSSSRQVLGDGVVLNAVLSGKFGTEEQEDNVVVVRLSEKRELVQIEEFTIPENF